MHDHGLPHAVASPKIIGSTYGVAASAVVKLETKKLERLW